MARRTRQFIAASRTLHHAPWKTRWISLARFARQVHPNSRTFPRSTDVRQISEFIDAFEPFGFAQIHRSWAVNLRRVREIRLAPNGGWEVRLDLPVNRVLPVSRRRISARWGAFR